MRWSVRMHALGAADLQGRAGARVRWRRAGSCAPAASPAAPARAAAAAPRAGLVVRLGRTQAGAVGPLGRLGAAACRRCRRCRCGPPRPRPASRPRPPRWASCGAGPSSRCACRSAARPSRDRDSPPLRSQACTMTGPPSPFTRSVPSRALRRDFWPSSVGGSTSRDLGQRRPAQAAVEADADARGPITMGGRDDDALDHAAGAAGRVLARGDGGAAGLDVEEGVLLAAHPRAVAAHRVRVAAPLGREQRAGR